MDFQPIQVSDFQCFGQKLSDVFEMDEERLRARVAFPAEHLIAVDGEIVEQVVLFGGRLIAECRKARFEVLRLAGMNFEIRMKAYEVGRKIHNRLIPTHGSLPTDRHVRKARIEDVLASTRKFTMSSHLNGALLRMAYLLPQAW